ncbi:hypothetical protein, partial [Polynucleobacter sp. JS-Polo-80-F4]|uniref:hypothetical protein n=1 Tax=Polynucleobacter sp. JS-Polo-80-F4 TaxID=2576918 RepID=UPI001C0E3BF4
SLTVKANNGAVYFNKAVGSNGTALDQLTIEANDTYLAANVKTMGDQTYHGPLWVGTWNGKTVHLVSDNGSIIFKDTVNDRNSWDEQNGWWAYDAPWLNAGSNSLSVSANNGIFFNKAVGGINPLNNLDVHGWAVAAANIETNGYQNYHDDLWIGNINPEITKIIRLTSNNESIIFNGAVNDATCEGGCAGNNSLAVRANYDVYFNKAVGALNPLNNLTVYGEANLAANVKTMGDQTYHGPLWVGTWNGKTVHLVSDNGSIIFKDTV